MKSCRLLPALSELTIYTIKHIGYQSVVIWIVFLPYSHVLRLSVCVHHAQYNMKRFNNFQYNNELSKNSCQFYRKVCLRSSIYKMFHLCFFFVKALIIIYIKVYEFIFYTLCPQLSLNNRQFHNIYFFAIIIIYMFASFSLNLFK